MIKQITIDALQLQRDLAIKWVFAIEGLGNPLKMEPGKMQAHLSNLTGEGKNPIHWTDQECEDFLIEIVKNGTANTICSSQATD